MNRYSFSYILFFYLSVSMHFSMICCEIEYEPFVDKALNISTVCSQPRQTGPCRASFPRFYYNSTEKQCRKFVYGGCDSNDNNFFTSDECQRVCINKTACMIIKLESILKPGCRYDLSPDKFGCPKNKIVCDVRPGKCPSSRKSFAQNSSITDDDQANQACTIQCAHSDQECQSPKKCCKIGCDQICVMSIQ
uniref:BPTI/Kunitz inhibitor domain-containing protein n=1 Tax=Romanomermis culicivorax TaxID=13658 RepID=A0A915HQ25_ROMCU